MDLLRLFLPLNVRKCDTAAIDLLRDSLGVFLRCDLRLLEQGCKCIGDFLRYFHNIALRDYLVGLRQEFVALPPASRRLGHLAGPALEDSGRVLILVLLETLRRHRLQRRDDYLRLRARHFPRIRLGLLAAQR